MESKRRVKLSAVTAAEAPPIPLTAHELVTLRSMVASAQRRSERRAKDNIESGLAQELPGADADAIRAATMAVLHGKLEAWCEMTWPLVDRADAALMAEGEPEDDEPEPEPEPEPIAAEVVEGEGETVGEARWKAHRELERRVGEVDARNVTFVTVSEGVRGLLGVGREPAKVMARLVTQSGS